MTEQSFERIVMEIPGPRSRELARRLQRAESRNVTYIADDFPIFWRAANGATVEDVDGNRYLDLTSAFGVSSVGHANAAVVDAANAQAQRLVHGMGDVHPTEVKVRLLERLASIAPGDEKKVLLASTGSEAIETALKTAVIATGRSRFVAYRSAYHGLSVGALHVAGIQKFRAPFTPILAAAATLLDYPHAADSFAHAVEAVRGTFAQGDVAALVVEPLQGRGGCVVPPDGFLAELRRLCDEFGVLLVLDEIYTGFYRTGPRFACEREGVTPDMLCLGKALGGGFPISATIAQRAVMDTWPRSTGEALHTSTYLGNPVACAAAFATLDEFERLDAERLVRERGEQLASRLDQIARRTGVVDVRGRGMMWGLQLSDGERASAVVKRALRRGVILLQAGPHGDVLSFTPPFVITPKQLARALDIVEESLT